MGVTAAVIASVVAAGATTASAIQSNQQAQHAKGAAEAQKTANDNQIADAQAADMANKKANATNASATQTAAIAALKASMSAGSGMGGSILTSPSGTGAAPTPVPSKTLLGI